MLCALLCSTNFLQAITEPEPTPVAVAKPQTITEPTPTPVGKSGTVVKPAPTPVAKPKSVTQPKPIAEPAPTTVTEPKLVTKPAPTTVTEPFTAAKPATPAKPIMPPPAPQQTTMPPVGPIQSSTPATIIKTNISPTTKMPFQINIKNTSNYQGTLTGFKILHVHKESNISHESVASGLKYTIKTAAASKDEVSLTIGLDLTTTTKAFIAGPSEISINNKPISVKPSLTATIYVTTTDGKNWQLDTKAMQEAQKKLSTPTPATPSAAKITEITKAAVVPLIEPETQLTTTVTMPAKSMASNAATKALATTKVM